MDIFSTEKPKFHFSVKKGWINDPNGLIFSNNRYHMFYQYFPEGVIWGPMHWGHATSKNLIDWREEEIALSPDKLGMIFSGSAVEGKGKNKGKMIAYYTNHLDKNDKKQEVQSIAFSDLDGEKWETYDKNPILIDENESDFRDPKVVFISEKNIWIMVVAAGKKINFYSSKDAIEWDKESFFDFPNLPIGIWECPELVKLKVINSDESIWSLKFDIVCEDRESISYIFFGKFDGSNFLMIDKNSYSVIDYGRDFYAAQSWYGIEKKNIWIGWMSDWKYASLIPCNEWRGVMTLPREIYLHKLEEKNYSLLQKPVKQFYEKLSEQISIKELKLKENENQKIFNGDFSYLKLENKESKNFKLKIGNDQEFVDIIYYDDKKSLIFNREYSGIIDFEESFKEKSEINLKENLRNLEIILDKNSIEIFINNGEYVLTSLIFPTSQYNEIKILNDSEIQSFENIEVKNIRLREGF